MSDSNLLFTPAEVIELKLKFMLAAEAKLENDRPHTLDRDEAEAFMAMFRELTHFESTGITPKIMDTFRVKLNLNKSVQNEMEEIAGKKLFDNPFSF